MDYVLMEQAIAASGRDRQLQKSPSSMTYDRKFLDYNCYIK